MRAGKFNLELLLRNGRSQHRFRLVGITNESEATLVKIVLKLAQREVLERSKPVSRFSPAYVFY